MFLRAIFVIFVFVLSTAAQAQSLAFTFDDGLDPLTNPDARQLNDQLLQTLKTTGITAMIFPSLACTGHGEGIALIAQWAANGHAVGNHTSKHRSLNSAKLSLNEFIQDVVDADAAFRNLSTWMPMLRFPYLKEGNTQEKRDGMREWMTRNDYLSAPVSIDASDWYFDSVFLQLFAAKQTEKLNVLRQAYIQHLLDRAAYYDSLAVRVIGRSPNHIMLLHVNAINAAWLPEVIAAFKQHDWKIITATEAFKDPLYRVSPDILPAGESIVWSLAKLGGTSGLRYPAEDSEYEEPQLRSLGLTP